MKQKILSILIILSAIFSLLIRIPPLANYPSSTEILIIEIICPILFLIAGTLLFITKKRNIELLKSGIIFIVSIIFFLNASVKIGISEGIRALTNAPQSQIKLMASILLYLAGIFFFIKGQKIN